MTVPGRVLVACVAVSLCCPPAVVASTSRARVKRREFVAVKRRRGSSAPLSVALEKAYELWGVEPCGGRYRVELTAVPPEVRGHAGWVEPAGSLGPYATPSGSWTGCAIELPAASWTADGVASEWPEACTVVLHEWGHLSGHPHSDGQGETSEPPGMTAEQLEVMLAAPPVDLRRCGWEP